MARPRTDIAPRILVAARKRFLRSGVDGATLRAIARDAGTSIGMIYYYFPTKDELFFSVVEELYRLLLHDIEQAIAPDVPVPERIERLFLRVARLSEDELLMLRLVAREALTSNTRWDRLRARFQTGHLPLIARLVVDGYSGGFFDRALHPMLAMLAVGGFGIFPQVVRRAMEGRLPFPGAPDGEELARGLVGILLRGTGAATK